MKQKLLFFSWLLFPNIVTQAQSGFVGIGTASPKAKLDIVSDTSGLLIPRYASLSLVNTSVLPIMSSSIHNGLMLYVDEAANRGFWYYNGSVFEKVGGTSSGGFFNVSSADTNNISYSDTSKYGKNFLVNHHSINYSGSGTDTKTMFLPTKSGAFRAGSIDGNYWDNSNIGDYSFASGFNTKASATGSTALGAHCTASNNYALSSGQECTASGVGSIAMGGYSTASNYYSMATGYFSTASGFHATAVGRFTTASGAYSMALGAGAEASNQGAFAIGTYSKASGDYSIALGASSKASGNNSTALGYITTASGNYATALGTLTKAFGEYSTAMGYASLSKSYAETVLGSFNDTLTTVNNTSFAGDSNRVFTVGNGIASAPHTAFVVQQNGNVGVGARVPNSLLEVKGAVAMPFEIISGSLSLSNAHYTVKFIGAIASSFTVTLPAAASCTGRVYKIINSASGAGATGILNTSPYLDYTNTSTTTVAKASAISVQSDGSNWHLIP